MDRGQPVAGAVESDLAEDLLGLIGRVFGQFVAAAGESVDYDQIAEAADFLEFNVRCSELSGYDPGSLQTWDERVSFWVNLFNMGVVRRIALDGSAGPPSARKGFFKEQSYVIGSLSYSLDDIEYGVLRGNAQSRQRPWRRLRFWDAHRKFAIEPRDPRICLALFHGARSSPPLSFFEAQKLEAQLCASADRFISKGGAVLDREAGTLSLSRLFKWCAQDFGGSQGVIKFIANSLQDPADAAYLRTHAASISVRFQEFDWGLNSADGQPAAATG